MALFLNDLFAFVQFKLLFIFFFCLQLSAQDFNPKILNLPDTLTHKDFSFLKEELKEVQVLLLGENTHFEGNIFETKTEIIKFLHQEMEFNTIAFESGIYDVWKAQQNIQKGNEVKPSIENALMPIWSKSEEFKSFMNFYENNKRELSIFGFDNQIPFAGSEKELVEDLNVYCKEHDFTFPFNSQDLELLIESFWTSFIFDQKDISYQEYIKAFTNLLTEIDQQPNEEKHFYWEQIIESLISIGQKAHLNSKPTLSTFVTTSDDNIRDKQMARNLLAYLEYFPNQKVICWGANAHFINNMSSIKADTVNKFIPMGSYIKNKMKNRVYSLALVTAEDSIQHQVWMNSVIKNGSFEYYLKKQNRQHLFISSNQKEMERKLPVRFFSDFTFVEGQLNELHDGYLFFKKTYPSTFIEDTETKNERKVDNAIEFHVLDKDNAIPIAFASVVIDNTNIKLKTNAHGEFSLSDAQVKKHKNKTLVISYEGYKKAVFNVNKMPEKIKLEKKIEELDEVIIDGKFSAKYIVKEAIKHIKKNYPTEPFNSNHKATIEFYINNESYLNFNVSSLQYDKGYNQAFRNSNQVLDVKWRVVKEKKPRILYIFAEKTFNTIQYAQYLNKRKTSKFLFTIEDKIKIKNEEVFIINFSTDRDHFAYTGRNHFVNYTGQIYVNKNDFAIVKMIQNWEVTRFPEENGYLFDQDWIKQSYKRYNIKHETLITNYSRKNDNRYYLTNSTYTGEGFLFSKNDQKVPYKEVISSEWENFNSDNLIPIKLIEENYLLKN